MFECKICNYKTNLKSNLTRHFSSKKHLKIEQNALENEKINGQKMVENGSTNGEPIFDPKNDLLVKQEKNICNYCQKQFSNKSHLKRHTQTCKVKKTIMRSGLYCMWNEKMIDEDGNNYYKLGRTSSRDSRISSYAYQYNLPKSKIQFLYEIEIENEKFAEKFLFYLLDEYRLDNTKELFKVNLKTIKDAMNNLKIILVNFPKPKNQEIILDNFDKLVNSESQNDEDNKYILSIINGDYEIIEKTKIIKQINKPYSIGPNPCTGAHTSVSTNASTSVSTVHDSTNISNNSNIINNFSKIIIDNNKFICNYCKKPFSQKYNMYRHRKECKKKYTNVKSDCQIKKEEEKENEKKEDENKQIEILLNFIQDQQKLMEKKEEEQRKLMEKKEEEQRKEKEEQRKFMEQIINKMNLSSNDDIKEQVKKEFKNISQQPNVMDQSQNHTTTNNGTYFEATNQNNLLNNLNLNYNNIISMDKFLYNMEHVNKICKSDLEAIAYASENMSEGDLADTIHKTIEKNCREQTEGMINPADGLEMIPVLPVVCSDGNCRSHKEKVNKFWETVYGDKHFDQMLNVIDKRLYEVLQKKIYLEEYGKKKLFKMIKRKHTIHDMRKFQEKINGPLDESKFKNISI